jgi:hypothetical protein
MLELFQKLYNFYMIKRQLKRSHYAAIMLRNSIKYGDCVEEKIYFKKSLRLLKTRLVNFKQFFNDEIQTNEWANSLGSIENILVDELFLNIDAFSVKCKYKNDLVNLFDAIAIGFYSLYKLNKYSNVNEIINLCKCLMSDFSELNKFFEKIRI